MAAVCEKTSPQNPQFSLIEALELLMIDPFPTKQYRTIVRLLKNLRTIVEELNKAKICYITDILEKLTITVPAYEPVTNHFVPSSEVHRMLSRLEVPSRINALLIKLLRYLIIKLNRCSDEDAASIFHDFKELRSCIYAFRKSSSWNKPRLDEIMSLFIQKLMRILAEVNADNWKEKFHLYAIMKLMLVELGKHPVYGAIIVKQLHEEIKLYYEQVELLRPDQEIDTYTYEVQFTFLYVLNEIIGDNFVDHLKECDAALLPDLKNILEALILKKLKVREAYLIHNVLRVIDAYLFFSK